MSENFDKIYDCLSGGSNGTPPSVDEWAEMLKLAKDDRDFDAFKATKLQNLLGFVGSNNWDAASFDMLEVLELIAENTAITRRRYGSEGEDIQYVLNRNLSTQAAISEYTGCPENYVCLMLCVLYDADLLEYGTSLQNPWISEEGLEILRPEYSDTYRKMIDPHNRMPEWQAY